MERTDKQENMCGGENRQVFSAACQSGVSAAGAGGLLCSVCDRLNVSENRERRGSYSERSNQVGLSYLDAAVDVCAIRADASYSIVVFDDVGIATGIHTVLMTVLCLHGLFPADCYNLCVGGRLCHRSGTGVKPKNADKDNDEEEHEALPQF